jgi:hypothetical protein
MRLEYGRGVIGIGVIALAVLGLASIGAQGYARLAAPYYAAVARLIARAYPWEIVSVDVRPSDMGPGSVLMLRGAVRRHASDRRPAARVVTRLTVGEAVETPAVYWTILLLWPAVSWRQRLLRVAVGVPLFLGLEAITTAVQLVHNLPEASALLAGEQDPTTVWELWSRFLEAGGRFVVQVCAVLMTVVIAGKLGAGHPARAHASAPPSAIRM